MDWSNENYVRLYTRETDDDLVLSWEARAVWHEMLKRFDRSGLIELRRGRKGLAAVLRMPIEVVERGIPELLEDGRVREIEAGYFAPNFMDAQEATKSDRQRQKESRDRRRAKHAGGDVTNRDETPSVAITAVTIRDDHKDPVTNRDANVTPPREVVTLTSADPSPASLGSPPARARAIPPSTEQGPSTTYDPANPLDRGRLAERYWRLFSDTLLAVAAEHGLRDVLPLPAITPGSESQGFRDLRDRIREEGALAPVVCERVLGNLARQARVQRDLDWLGEKAFRPGAWRTARETRPGELPNRDRAGPRAPAARAPETSTRLKSIPFVPSKP